MAPFLPQLTEWQAAERELQALERCWRAALTGSADDAVAPLDLQARLLAKRQLVHDLFRTAMDEAKARALHLDHRAPVLLGVLEEAQPNEAEPVSRHPAW